MCVWRDDSTGSDVMLADETAYGLYSCYHIGCDTRAAITLAVTRELPSHWL